MAYHPTHKCFVMLSFASSFDNSFNPLDLRNRY